MKVKTEFKFKFSPEELVALVGICLVAYAMPQGMTDREVAMADFFIDQFGDLHDQMTEAEAEEQQAEPAEVIH